MSATKKMWMRRMSFMAPSPISSEDQISRNWGIGVVICAAVICAYVFKEDIVDMFPDVEPSNMAVVTPQMIKDTLAKTPSHQLSCVKAGINREIDRATESLPFYYYELKRATDICAKHGAEGFSRDALKNALR